MEEQSYTSTHRLGHTGPVTGSLYLLDVSEETTSPLLPRITMKLKLDQSQFRKSKVRVHQK